MKFRKKSIIVEAAQYFPGVSADAVPGLCRDACMAWPHVHTANGPVALQEGDWVIAECDGSGYYPCKNSIFQATYEPA